MKLHQIKNHPFDYNIDQVNAFPMPSFIFHMNSYTTEFITTPQLCFSFAHLAWPYFKCSLNTSASRQTPAHKLKGHDFKYPNIL